MLDLDFTRYSIKLFSQALIPTILIMLFFHAAVQWLPILPGVTEEMSEPEPTTYYTVFAGMLGALMALYHTYDPEEKKSEE
jgi:hypothetical protein